MSYFVAEANGRAIVVFTAPTKDEAYDFLNEEKPEFVLLGACDETDELFLRDAFDHELDRWRRRVVAAVADGELESVEEAEGSNYVVFLVPVADPTDDDLEADDE
jgi:hypothetical protein